MFENTSVYEPVPQHLKYPENDRHMQNCPDAGTRRTPADRRVFTVVNSNDLDECSAFRSKRIGLVWTNRRRHVSHSSSLYMSMQTCVLRVFYTFLLSVGAWQWHISSFSWHQHTLRPSDPFALLPVPTEQRPSSDKDSQRNGGSTESRTAS